jgi:type I restriction enzyme R subunit
VFCVTNAHADMVVDELRTAFKKKYPQLEHDAIIKITGDADKDAKKVQSMIVRFNKERLPNIVVTVDLLTTGVDIPSICNIVFLRKVKSRILYEQMKGRATRLCPSVGKTSFKIFDCVDIYSSLESVDTMRPVVVRPQVELQTLVNEITDSETYKTIEADGRSFAEHSHEQLVAKLQRLSALPPLTAIAAKRWISRSAVWTSCAWMPRASTSAVWLRACGKKDRTGAPRFSISFPALSPASKG